MTKDDVLRMWGEQAEKAVGLPHDEFVFMFTSAVAELEREACITAFEDAWIEGLGSKGCIDAVRRRANVPTSGGA